MPETLLYILWDIRPQIFDPDVSPVRWYGLLFALSFLIGQLIITLIFRWEGKPQKDLEWLMIYMVISTIVGARLGHCFFYEPLVYISKPVEILYIWKGGLDGHGAALGILLALYFYSRKRPEQPYFWLLDRIVIVVALAASLIRFGNLINAENEGLPTQNPMAFVFAQTLDERLTYETDLGFDYSEKRFLNEPDTLIQGIPYTPLEVKLFFKNSEESSITSQSLADFLYQIMGPNTQDELSRYLRILYPLDTLELQEEGEHTTCQIQVYGIPRHPAQLYESLSSLLVFFFLAFLYYTRRSKTPHGLLFAWFMLITFSLRFFYEFFKENQVPFEEDLALNMGQALSIPAILSGLILFYLIYTKSIQKYPLPSTKISDPSEEPDKS